MFLEIDDLLTPAEVARLRSLAASSRFVDGRISNPHSQVKRNLHQDRDDPKFNEASQMMAAALHRSEAFRLFAFPRRFAAPQLTKHGAKMAYGLHSDAAHISSGQAPIRTDLSCTIFISEPSEFDGGELAVQLGTREILFKGAPGAAIVYPSTTLHEVKEVRSGERIVGITFVESLISDIGHRNLVYELGEVSALEGLRMSWGGRTRLDTAINNLKRMWMDLV